MMLYKNTKLMICVTDFFDIVTKILQTDTLGQYLAPLVGAGVYCKSDTSFAHTLQLFKN